MKSPPRRDVYLRQRLFVPESFDHPARANLYMLADLVKSHIQPGSRLLDPMAGIGSLLVMATYGYPVHCIELEERWVAVAHSNAEKLRNGWLFTNSMDVQQGDARRLNLETGQVEASVFSPPYWDMFSDWHMSSRRLTNCSPAYADERGVPSEDKANIGNIHVYELYLRAMRQVYAEQWRVLQPGGIMILILKDRVHKHRRIHLTADTLAICRVLGFQLVEHRRYQTRASRYRHVYRIQNPDGPRVEHESALVLRKAEPPPSTEIALIGGPKRATGPGWILFLKMCSYAQMHSDRVFVLDQAGFRLTSGENGHEPGPGLDHPKAAQRRTWCQTQIRHLVAKHLFGAGARFELHLPRSHGQYLAERLETLGATVTNPTEGLNLGQKLAWYTERGC